MNYDLWFFNAVYGLAGKNAVIDYIGIFLADSLPYILFLCLFYLLFSKKDRVMAILAINSGLATRFIIKGLMLLYWQRPRPYVVLPGVVSLIWLPWFDNLQSFPSGHVLFFFAASTMIYFFHPKWGIFFFLASLAMGIARIFAGVHWPSDILVGMLLGMATSFVIYHAYTTLYILNRKHY